MTYIRDGVNEPGPDPNEDPNAGEVQEAEAANRADELDRAGTL